MARAACRLSRRPPRRHSVSSATSSAATSRTQAASSPSTMAIPPPACIRSRSSSTARSTWTSGVTSAAPCSPGSRVTSPCWPTAWRTFPPKSCGHSALPPSRLSGPSCIAARQQDIAPLYWARGCDTGDLAQNVKEKGPLASKRPKSREETPKEGGGTRRKSCTALQQDTPHRTKGKRCPPGKIRLHGCVAERPHPLTADRRIGRAGGQDAKRLRGKHQ